MIHEPNSMESRNQRNCLPERSLGARETQMIHELKSWPEFFEATASGAKTHDLRRSDDRTFNIGDILRLREFDPKTETYTGQTLDVEVTYITSHDSPCALSDAALNPKFCILSIRRI